MRTASSVPLQQTITVAIIENAEGFFLGHGAYTILTATHRVSAPAFPPEVERATLTQYHAPTANALSFASSTIASQFSPHDSVHTSASSSFADAKHILATLATAVEARAPFPPLFSLEVTARLQFPRNPMQRQCSCQRRCLPSRHIS
jgi:hypothetical protein